jgi:hypothetical protein
MLIKEYLGDKLKLNGLDGMDLSILNDCTDGNKRGYMVTLLGLEPILFGAYGVIQSELSLEEVNNGSQETA